MGRHLLVALPLVALITGGAACYRVHPVDCAITCDEGHCPEGLTCGDDDFCHTASHTADCQAIGPDASCQVQAVALMAGFKQSCLLASDGSVWCWGLNESGEQGDVAARNRLRATRITSWPSAQALDGGKGHSCALDPAGAVRCAGLDADGQLGDGPADTSGTGAFVQATALAEASEVAAGGFFTCARVASALWCWGAGDSGQLGNGASAPQDAPSSVVGIADATSVAAGFRHACAVRTGGAVSCWGYGWLGNNVPAPGGSNMPVLVATADYVQVASGLDASCGLKTDGTVWCWGWNNDAQCTGTDIEVLAPLSTGLAGATEVALGAHHSCARLEGGTVWCWGENDFGQIGDGAASGTLVTAPTQVMGLDDATALDLGEDYACALRGSGDVVCWGNNDEGQLGDGSEEARSAPVPLSFTCASD